MVKKAKHSPRRIEQQGVVAIWLAISSVFLVGVGAFGVDFAMAFVQRNELQTAADAAALAGAAKLLPTVAGAPNWGGGQTAANNAVGLNKAGNVALTNGTVTTGCWHFKTSTLQAITTCNLLEPDPLDKTAPAIMVKISKEAGINGGPMNTIFGRTFGVASMPVAATAVAFVSGPGSVGPGELFPVALAKPLYDLYWDPVKNQPKNDPATGQPYSFKIGSSYHYPTSEAGQWTSFNVDSNNVPTIRDLITNGNPNAMSVGNASTNCNTTPAACTWIEPGTKTALYASVPTNTDVLMPVVLNVDTKSRQPIVAFAPFHIDMGVGGSGKYIQGHFIANYKIPSSAGIGGVGTFYGGYIPPRLVQ